MIFREVQWVRDVGKKGSVYFVQELLWLVHVILTTTPRNGSVKPSELFKSKYIISLVVNVKGDRQC